MLNAEELGKETPLSYLIRGVWTVLMSINNLRIFFSYICTHYFEMFYLPIEEAKLR